MSSTRVTIDQSAHQQLPGAFPFAWVEPERRFRTTLFLRRRPDGPPFPDPFELGALPPRKRKPITYEEFEARYGADPADVDRVRAFVEQYGLQVVETNLECRTVILEGPAAGYAAAFATSILRYMIAGRTYRSTGGPLHVPSDLQDVVVGVIGLDTRPVAQPAVARHPGFHPMQLAAAQTVAAAAAQQHAMQRAPQVQQAATKSLAPNEWPSSRMQQMQADAARTFQEAQRAAMLAMLEALGVKTPPQVARLYNFPEDTDGSGQTIAILEMGGGYQRQELEAYFSFLGVPMPQIVDVSIHGAVNAPGQQMDADSEVVLDISVAGGAAPGAKLAIYFTPNSPPGYIAAVQAAIHDRVNRPSVISISWDQAESNWLQIPGIMALFDAVLAEAAILGVTVCCSSGDFGAYGMSAQQFQGTLQVDYPGSNPYVLACGGTTLISQGDTAVNEYAWNSLQETQQATGGGVSRKFSVPPWQQNANVPQSMNPGQGTGRGVPDVAGNADARTGYLVSFDGHTTVVGGTSAVSPLWSALLARINQSLGTNVGYINPILYSQAAQTCFRDIIAGDNGAYPAGPGWDACTGLGTPDGTKLRDFLGAAG